MTKIKAQKGLLKGSVIKKKPTTLCMCVHISFGHENTCVKFCPSTVGSGTNLELASTFTS